MQEKIFVYPRCPENERLTTALYFKYSGGIEIECDRSESEISLKLIGTSPIALEAIKDLMANVCYLIES